MATDLLLADTAVSAPRESAAGAESLSTLEAPDQVAAGQDLAVARPQHEAAGEHGAARGNDLSGLVSDLVQLTKPRIVVMILVTTVATAIIASGGWVPLSSLAWLLVGTGAVAASAGAANQIWERKIDRHMPRTVTRPLPDGRIGPLPAAIYTAALGWLGTWLLATRFGSVPAVIGLITWLAYVVVYTPLKTRSAWNTTVGAVAGALPMLIGYTALGGSPTDTTAWCLVGILVAWQYPHFMAIAWIYRRQYREAGFRMTTTVEPTGRSAAIQSVLGSLALIAFAVVLCIRPAGLIPGAVCSLAVLACCYPMLRASIKFARCPSDPSARGLLRSSLLVLPAVLAIVTLRVFW